MHPTYSSPQPSVTYRTITYNAYPTETTAHPDQHLSLNSLTLFHARGVYKHARTSIYKIKTH
jgi:hypothetical protein